MDRLLYVGCAFHTKTRSVDFFLDLLRRHFEVEEYLIEGRPEDEIARKGRDRYAAVVFLQVNPANYINHFKRQNIVFVPMYDAFPIGKRRNLLFLSKVKWICFSEKYRPFLGGIESLFVRYYPEPRAPGSAPPGETFFFWQRRKEIDWHVVKQLIGDSRVEAVNVHSACDPGVEFKEPAEGDRRRYNISISRWFDSKDDLEKLMIRFRYFFAPRMREGIGQSFLDAMAMGMVVIAPNDATMNEYIVNGENGYLYDPMRPKPIAFSDFDAVREKSIRSVAEGRKAWLDSEDSIIDFISKKPKRISYPINKRTAASIMGTVGRFFRRG